MYLLTASCMPGIVLSGGGIKVSNETSAFINLTFKFVCVGQGGWWWKAGNKANKYTKKCWTVITAIKQNSR